MRQPQQYRRRRTNKKTKKQKKQSTERREAIAQDFFLYVPLYIICRRSTPGAPASGLTVGDFKACGH
jgi:uncharacterized protein (DUF2062 family)